MIASASAFAPTLPRSRTILRMSDEDTAEAPAPAPAPASGALAVMSQAPSVGQLEAMSVELNPIVKMWDPLGMTEMNIFDSYGGESATVGFLREAEVKHGRVAMAAFVGYIVHANHITFPAHVPGDYSSLTPEQTWDALPVEGKWQIILFVGLLELWSEGSRGLTGEHYMKGGKPGYFPPFNTGDGLPHPALNLWDPFGITAKASPEKKAKSLLAEINNGRLAMLGIMGFVSASAIDGSVPALTNIIPHYDGNVWIPFEGNFDSVLHSWKQLLFLYDARFP